MKKIFLILFLFLIVFTYAQQESFYYANKYSDQLYNVFSLNFEVLYSKTTLVFIDHGAFDWDDAFYGMGIMLESIDSFWTIERQRVLTRQGIVQIIYEWYFNGDGDPVQIIFPIEWINAYMKLGFNNNAKYKMLDTAITPIYNEWYQQYGKDK